MTDNDRVIELIECGKETGLCDFKREFYHMSKKSDIIKDILAFANSTIYGDKYIIFNVDDKTRQLCDMRIDTIPDVSEINGLLREYCEPNIGIEMCIFPHKGTNVAYIKILKDSFDKPYMVKKDYARNGKTILQQGQVFIRRNSDNFIANRRDLDEIYESRTKRKVQICTEEIEEKEFVVKNRVENYFVIDFIFENDDKANYLIEEIKVFLKFKEHCFSCYIKDIIDVEGQKSNEKEIINNTPFSIEPYTTIHKGVRFKLSSTCIEQIKECYSDDNVFVWLEVLDVKKKKLCSDMIKCIIKFNK